MSFAVDVNVLLYASDASSPLHARARAALMEWVAGPVRPRGALVPDAHLAAILRQHWVTVLHTNDRDLRRFDFLQIRNPFGE